MKNRKLFVAGYSSVGPELVYTTLPVYERPVENDFPKFITKFYSTKVIEEWSSKTEEILTIKDTVAQS